jgi:hypothetical protein
MHPLFSTYYRAYREDFPETRELLPDGAGKYALMLCSRLKREDALEQQVSHEERITRSDCINTAIIRTEQLSRSFGSVQAVNELSLEVPGGSAQG